jgi:magnesium transporter
MAPGRVQRAQRGPIIGAMITDCAVYERGIRRPGVLELQDAFEVAHGEESFVWLGLHEPTPEEFDEISKEFSLHHLAVEDALAPHQRPKLEVYDGGLFVVLKTARYVDPDEVIEFGQIMLFVGERFVITVRHGSPSPLGGVRRELEGRKEFLALGPGAVLHAVVDRVVDDYGPVIHGVDHDVEEIELQVFSPEYRTSIAERIYKLKREVLAFHRATAPLIDPLDWLMRSDCAVVHPEVRKYVRDAHDHLLRIVEEVAGFNNLLTSMLDANLAQISLQQSMDMRRISAWVAILAVPTMIAGIYGMNFEHMPELRWVSGYPLALLLMASVCTWLYVRFKRSGWL